MEWLALITALIVSVPAAEDSRKISDLVASMASGLSEGNVEQFVQALDPAMPGYHDLAANVRALTAQTDVLSAIEVLAETGDARHRNVELDWFLEITLKIDPLNLVRRREIVKCRLEKQKNKWRVVAIEPAALFAP